MITKHRKTIFMASGGALILLMLVSLVYHMAVNGWGGSLGLNLGIDFTGGTVIQLNLGEDFKIEEIKEILAEFDLEGATIQKVKTREAGGNLADEGGTDQDGPVAGEHQGRSAECILRPLA